MGCGGEATALPVLSKQRGEDARYKPDQPETEDVCRGVAADAGVACGDGRTETAEEFSVIRRIDEIRINCSNQWKFRQHDSSSKFWIFIFLNISLTIFGCE